MVNNFVYHQQNSSSECPMEPVFQKIFCGVSTQTPTHPHLQQDFMLVASILNVPPRLKMNPTTTLRPSYRPGYYKSNSNNNSKINHRQLGSNKSDCKNRGYEAGFLLFVCHVDPRVRDVFNIGVHFTTHVAIGIVSINEPVDIAHAEGVCCN